jgi:SAM-dependent methyltransferase
MATLDTYLSGIEKAENDGLINFSFASYYPSGVVFPHSNIDLPSTSHIPFYIGSNRYSGYMSNMITRSLTQVIDSLLPAFCGRDSLNFLELGIGTGRASYEFYKWASKNTGRFDMKGVSFVPINPFMPLELRGDELLALLEQNYKATSRHRIGNFYVNNDMTYWYLPSDMVFSLQDKGNLIFGLLDSPFISKQYIGCFPDEIRLEDSFDIIYENMGPVFYNDETSSFKMAHDHLSQSGILVFSSSPVRGIGKTIREDDVSNYLSSKDVLVVNPDCTQAVLVAGENKLNKKIKKLSNYQVVVTRNLSKYFRQMV